MKMSLTGNLLSVNLDSLLMRENNQYKVFMPMHVILLYKGGMCPKCQGRRCIETRNLMAKTMEKKKNYSILNISFIISIKTLHMNL